MWLGAGAKVIVLGEEENGFGEIVGPAKAGFVEVAYYSGPVQHSARRAPLKTLGRPELSNQTRCYFIGDNGTKIGRVVDSDGRSAEHEREYFIKFPNESIERKVLESDFHVRSFLGVSDPLTTLSALAQETPFFFERRFDWVNNYSRQVELSHGLTGFISSKIELFPHQAEVVNRVLQDPTIRYLLADEVGLGKTIEAGTILRQLRLDRKDLRILAFVPPVVLEQWRRELSERFGIRDARILPHENLLKEKHSSSDVLVIDEAHRVVPVLNKRDHRRELFDAACGLSNPQRTPHVLLLSATPVLHHEEELLALLHLLDPETYSLDDLESFRSRLEKRRDIGRALMVLSRATNPAFIQRQANTLAALLPGDPSVVRASDEISVALARDQDEEYVKRVAVDLRIHVTETYRVHRRMLRTRRAVLIEQGEFTSKRKEKGLEFEADSSHDTNVRRLWEVLEEWRIAAAAQHLRPEELNGWIARYLALARALATDRLWFRAIVDSRLRAGPEAFEVEHLQQMSEIARRSDNEDRTAGVLRAIARIGGSKWVVFCGPNKVAKGVYDALTNASGAPVALLASTLSDRDGLQAALDRFRYDARYSLLIADESVEEGLNLEIADGMLLYDLPFEPMRLEQRVGRLDRINRIKEVRCACILTLDDSALALDRAWYQIVKEGFGLFDSSLSDLQFLVEKELTNLGETAFQGGPAALLSECARLQTAVTAERQAAEEQDVIDGLYGSDPDESKLWTDISEGDSEERDFANAINNYIHDSLGLSVWNEGKDARDVFTYRKRQKVLPLIPAGRLVGFAGYVNAKSTFIRRIACKHTDYEFLRPGHPLVESLRTLADWDERGQAFALWRSFQGFAEPQVFFRVCVVSSVDIPARNSHEKQDQSSLASLLRLIESWAPIRRYEIFLDTNLKTPSEEVVKVCERRYSNRGDINLGGERAQAILSLTSAKAWSGLCREAANKAISEIRDDRQEIARLETARQSAHEYFEIIQARLRARRHWPMEDVPAIDKQSSEFSALEDQILQVIASPGFRIDSMGVYVLSEQPSWIK